MPNKGAILFVSDMDGVPWGGSEELWSRAAMQLARQGLRIKANVHKWIPPHERVVQMGQAGVQVQFRSPRRSLWSRTLNRALSPKEKPINRDLAKFLMAEKTAMVVFCCGGVAPPVEWLRYCVAKGLPFVTISQSNSVGFWPFDDYAAELRELMPTALRCFFVSNANWRLFEYQIGTSLPNGEIVFNPFNVDVDAAPPWPPLTEETELRLACVARLHPPSKGQDLLIEALAGPDWDRRPWHLTLYGDGPMKTSIQRLINRFDLDDRISLSGFVHPIENVWAENHALVLPSRYEGMPLVIVEAMLCGRPAVVTDVASHAEIVHEGTNGFLATAPTVGSLRDVLERVWINRMNLEQMGKEAARSIRATVPRDPEGIFAEKIKDIASHL
jgi:glycosyltransferase involved in cell wall biosynthesis